MTKHKPRTWGSVYLSWLRRDVDHGYAAWMADRWEKRQERQKVLTALAEKAIHQEVT